MIRVSLVARLIVGLLVCTMSQRTFAQTSPVVPAALPAPVTPAKVTDINTMTGGQSPCSLLTADEIETDLNVKVSAGVDTGGGLCNWPVTAQNSTGVVAVRTQWESPDQFNTGKNFPHPRGDRQLITGVGTEAYTYVNTFFYYLHVLQGTKAFYVELKITAGGNTGAYVPFLRALAAIVIKNINK
jgi:hypothetical protein